MARPLRDDLNHGGREIGICIYGHPLKRNGPSDDQQYNKHQHQKALTKRHLYDLVNHCFCRCAPNRLRELPSQICSAPVTRRSARKSASRLKFFFFRLVACAPNRLRELPSQICSAPVTRRSARKSASRLKFFFFRLVAALQTACENCPLKSVLLL